MSKRKITFISLASAAGVLIVLLAGYLLYFGLGERALPGVKIGEIDVTGKTAKEIEAQLNDVVKTEQINFTGNKLAKKSAKLTDLGITLETAAAAKSALTPNSSFGNYFTLPFTGKKITPKLNVNQDALIKYASQLAAQITDAKPAVEPKIIAEGEEFKIVSGQSGLGIDSKILSNAAEQLVNQQKSVAVKIELSEIKPKISEAELKTTKAAAEKYVASEVSITAGKRTISADKPTRVNWISFENNKAVLNEAALKKWLTDIANPLSKKAVAGTRNVTNSGNVVEIVKKAQAEEKVTNFDEVFKTIKDNLQKGQNTQAALNVEVGTETWKDRIIAPGAENLTYKATVGEKWIDVNLSTFKMTAYEGATRVRGPITVVTGESETPTITGKYKIWHKTKVQDMRGTHPDGTEYHAKDVPWNMFFHGDYAIHGAPWWGPNQWGFQGSSGCVNTPTPDAKWLYNWAPMGTVVVTHY